MINQLHGTIIHRSDKLAIIEVGGVGYRVFLSDGDLKKLPRTGTVRLWTHLVVRDNALDLFGFLESRTLEFFELLITVPGIGPKSALAILSLADTGVLGRAITTADHQYLTKVSGIGKKSAEKIVLTLKDKIGGLVGDVGEAGHHSDAEVMEALQALGYNLRQAREAVQKIPASVTGASERVKAALGKLNK